MPRIVDARGLSCPQPVVATRQALQEGEDEVITIVDNETAKQNVSRLAVNQGFEVSVEEKEGAICLHLTRKLTGPKETPSTRVSGPTVLLISSEGLGWGSEELGGILMRSFIHTLGEATSKVNKIIFINSGVRLVAKGSEVVNDLRELERGGVEILACGTCLGYYELKEQVEVGQVSNMYAIVEGLLQAGKIIAI